MTQDKHQQTDGSRIDTTTRRGALAALGGAGLLAALGGGAQANVGGGDDADELSHLLSRFYEGPEDELPEAGVEGRRFFVTDSGGQYKQWTLLRDQGDAWDPVDLTLGALGSDSLDTEGVNITSDGGAVAEYHNGSAVVRLGFEDTATAGIQEAINEIESNAADKKGTIYIVGEPSPTETIRINGDGGLAFFGGGGGDDRGIKPNLSNGEHLFDIGSETETPSELLFAFLGISGDNAGEGDVFYISGTRNVHMYDIYARDFDGNGLHITNERGHTDDFYLSHTVWESLGGDGIRLDGTKGSEGVRFGSFNGGYSFNNGGWSLNIMDDQSPSLTNREWRFSDVNFSSCDLGEVRIAGAGGIQFSNFNSNGTSATGSSPAILIESLDGAVPSSIFFSNSYYQQGSSDVGVQIDSGNRIGFNGGHINETVQINGGENVWFDGGLRTGDLSINGGVRQWFETVRINDLTVNSADEHYFGTGHSANSYTINDTGGLWISPNDRWVNIRTGRDQLDDGETVSTGMDDNLKQVVGARMLSAGFVSFDDTGGTDTQFDMILKDTSGASENEVWVSWLAIGETHPSRQAQRATQ